MAMKRINQLVKEVNNDLGTDYSVEKDPGTAYRIGYWKDTIFHEKTRYNTSKEMEAFLEGLKYHDNFTK